jgi:lantibiotic leader peptide-processing serine protease
MRKFFVYASAAVVAIATAGGAGATGASTTGGSAGSLAGQTSAGAQQSSTEYVVLYSPGADIAVVKDAVAAAGGTFVSQNAKVGYAVARSSSTSFATNVDKSTAVVGAARNRVIGAAPQAQRARSSEVERMTAERRAVAKTPAAAAKAAPAPPATPLAEPLANRQWDMRQIGATPTGSYARQPGKAGVVVGVIDTGIDGTHPDIAANFDGARSRNFVTDMPSIDGPTCEVPSCVDPANVDDNGHGTHVASTIASPINGLGMAGVAPKVTVVNLRAGQDSGYFFLAATLAALTYAGDIGVDVVNMSFYTDPWLFNCTSNPADSPSEQAEQRVIREATQRAVNYARGHGVLPVAAMGNESTDLNSPATDPTSPDFPPGSERDRTIDNSCISVPNETTGVLSVSSTGISTRLAYYSNYGTEQTEVAAPGGDLYDSTDNTSDPRNMILAAYPKSLAELDGALNPDGTSNTPFVVRDCKGTICGYYQYIQGTSMAAPHAAGVAALIVSEFGKADRRLGGLTLPVQETANRLTGTAVEHACPEPRLLHYTRIRPTAPLVVESESLCEGPKERNGFYGSGIVNAYAAVTGRR